MSIKTSVRFAVHPSQGLSFNTTQLRENFLVDTLFEQDAVNLVYTHYDRFIVGGIMPRSKALPLPTFESLKSEFFLQRREAGIINVGSPGTVVTDGTTYKLGFKEALYLGQGTKDVAFSSDDASNPAMFYLNSAPAHTSYPSMRVTFNEAETVELGSPENANARTLRKLIVQSIVKTCQLQMGMTELKPGSIWNTMPAHTHDRRMEVYFYFDIKEGNSVCHFMGDPAETRHIWMQNNQAVISPPWSIHSGAGTSNYSFIWGMAGENLDYGDMDVVAVQDLR